MARLLDGKLVRDKIKKDLAERVGRLPMPPVLSIASVGERSDSLAFIAAKETFAKEIGVRVERIKFPENVSEGDIRSALLRSAMSDSVHGIILQLPIPEGINKVSCLNLIPSEKDIDGLSAVSMRLLLEGKPHMTPATARGIVNMLDAYDISVPGKRIVVVGRSVLVGKSVALSMLQKDATVTLCHRKTEHLADITKEADILIVAAGVPRLIGRQHVREGQVVIDVGITKSGEADPDTGKFALLGDVDFAAVETVVEAISPVPGGVGPMTVSALFQNLVEAAEQKMQPA